jgi:hypothetical protein
MLADVARQLAVDGEILVRGVAEAAQKVQQQLGRDGRLRTMVLDGHWNREQDGLRVGLDIVTADNAAEKLQPLARLNGAVIAGETVITLNGCAAGKHLELMKAFSRTLPGALFRASEKKVWATPGDLQRRYPLLWEGDPATVPQTARILHCENGSCRWLTRQEDSQVISARYSKGLQREEQAATPEQR